MDTHTHDYVATTSETLVENPLRCKWCGRKHPFLTNVSGPKRPDYRTTLPDRT